MNWAEVIDASLRIAGRWRGKVDQVYGIPSGGAPVALIVSQALTIPICDKPGDPDRGPVTLVVDDLVDTGSTMRPYTDHPHDACFRKPWTPQDLAPHAIETDEWLVFPWEHSGAPEDAVTRILQYIGVDPTSEGLRDTPKRVTKAFREMTTGYQDDPEKILSTVFEEKYDQMVVLSDIEFVSLCEHHLLPFRGTATVGYIPDGKVVGLSKLARLVDCYARRLQVQERMTEQIAQALIEHLNPVGVGVYVTAHHSCMGNRGVRKHEGRMSTQALHGAMMNDGNARAEFMRLAQG